MYRSRKRIHTEDIDTSSALLFAARAEMRFQDEGGNWLLLHNIVPAANHPTSKQGCRTLLVRFFSSSNFKDASFSTVTTPTFSSVQELSLAALREPRNIEDAAKAKEMLLRARAPEAAVWVLSDPNFLEHACRLLVGFVKLGATTGGAEAGFGLCRRLRLFVLQLSPAIVAVRCLRRNVGPPEVRRSYLNPHHQSGFRSPCYAHHATTT